MELLDTILSNLPVLLNGRKKAGQRSIKEVQLRWSKVGCKVEPLPPAFRLRHQMRMRERVPKSPWL